MRCVRRVISSAARRVKVRSRMRSGLAPDSTRCATRCASVLVLPVPAPAMISRGPDPNCAASCCRGFSVSMADPCDTSVTIPRLSPFSSRALPPGAKKLAVGLQSAVSFSFQIPTISAGSSASGGLRWLKPSLSARTTKRQIFARRSPDERDIQRISARQACCSPVSI